MADGLRARTVLLSEPDKQSGKEEEQRKENGKEKVLDNLKNHLKKEWDSLLWIFAMFGILYYSEFISNLLFNPRIDRAWLAACVLSFLTCVSSLLYISFCKTYQDNISTWDKSTAALVATVCLSTCVTAISFVMAAWRVWHIWSILMVPVFFMGFISVVTLLEL